MQFQEWAVDIGASKDSDAMNIKRTTVAQQHKLNKNIEIQFKA